LTVIGPLLGLTFAMGMLLAQDDHGEPVKNAVGVAPGPAAQGEQVAGDPGRGRAVLEGKGACLTCHRIANKGSRMGRDLTDIGSLRSAEALQKSVLDPQPVVQPQNRMFRVVTKEGAVITGKLLNQDTSSLQMLDSSERLVGFSKSNIREYGFIESPPMPSYRNKLLSAEAVDLIAYLASLKGISQ
jgi:putative heme-binding domain-containing protein